MRCDSFHFLDNDPNKEERKPYNALRADWLVLTFAGIG
jgi:hypothetical protein